MSTLELPSPPWVVGHRGAAGEACENTLTAFRVAQEARVDMIELDVQLAADGVLVCHHDWDLERLAGRAEVVEKTASGLVTDIPIGPNGDLIPTLTEALADIPESTPLNVELKRRTVEAAALARTVLETLDGRAQVLVSSFDWNLLGSVRTLAPDLSLAPLSAPREIRVQLVDPAGDLIAVGEALNAFSLHCSRFMVEPAFVDLARARGFERMLSYTVNDPEQAEELFRAGVSGIFTDLPSTMVLRFHGAAEPSPRAG